MHLVIVSPFPPNTTGISQYSYYISRALAQSGVFSRITVLAGAAFPSQSNIPTAPVAVERVWQTEHLDATRLILARLRRLTPDLVWFNLGASIFGQSPLANLVGCLSPGLAQRSGYPTIVTLHELVELADLRALNAPGGPFARLGARLLTNFSTRADVVCLTMRRYVEWFKLHRPSVRCMHIPIGAYDLPENLPEPATQKLLLFTTQAPYKGIELLLEAHRLLLPNYPALQLTISGMPHPRFPAYSENLRQKYGYHPGVHWIGQVRQEEVRSLFQNAQLIILPYTASTGSSSVLFQAAMWGRPAVVSDLEEIRSMVSEIGLQVDIFKTGDIASLLQAIQAQLNDPKRRKAQVEHNMRSIMRMLPEHIASLYLQAFNLALQASDSPKRLKIPLSDQTGSI